MGVRTTNDKPTKARGGPVDAVQAAADYGIGIDIAQLRDNLALPVAERFGRHPIDRNTLENVRRSKRP